MFERFTDGARRRAGPLPQGELTPHSGPGQRSDCLSRSRRSGAIRRPLGLATRIGLQPVGGQMLAAADRLAR